ncbi:MAG: hypothetical protein ACREOZ_03880 [Gloeomargaritales cyanobacterium]
MQDPVTPTAPTLVDDEPTPTSQNSNSPPWDITENDYGFSKFIDNVFQPDQLYSKLSWDPVFVKSIIAPIRQRFIEQHILSTHDDEINIVKTHTAAQKAVQEALSDHDHMDTDEARGQKIKFTNSDTASNRRRAKPRCET